MIPSSVENIHSFAEGSPEQGINWQVERNTFSPEVATAACDEIFSALLEVKQVEEGRFRKRMSPVLAVRPGCEGFVVPQKSRKDIVGVYRVACVVEQSGWSEYTDYIENHPDIAARIPTLLHLFRQSKVEIGSTAKGFALNIYKPGGIFPQHQDRIPGPTRSLNLLGIRTLYMRDIASGGGRNFDLGVGDRFDLQNPMAETGRPWHALENRSSTTSIGLIV